MQKQKLKGLLIEDNKGDALLIQKMTIDIPSIKVELITAESLDEAFKTLKKHDFDIILSDLNLPDSEGFDTFIKLNKKVPDIPIIVLSGLLDEDIAIDAVRKGAQDYLVKGMVNNILLGRSIRYAIERKRLTKEREELINKLQKALEEVKTLSGLLPICASCKNIRDDKGYWKKVEIYFSEHSDAEFTHSICPDCMKKLYPELSDEKE